MLSGGERALTAVALLFAMLEVRPVPFCVLDEVDAALDEANIGRFADALRSLADQTQFIVITHNRGTIEAADALYGVTVGDDSVSRVISLRLDEAQALAARERRRARRGGLDRMPLLASAPRGTAATAAPRPTSRPIRRRRPGLGARPGRLRAGPAPTAARRPSRRSSPTRRPSRSTAAVEPAAAAGRPEPAARRRWARAHRPPTPSRRPSVTPSLRAVRPDRVPRRRPEPRALDPGLERTRGGFMTQLRGYLGGADGPAVGRGRGDAHRRRRRRGARHRPRRARPQAARPGRRRGGRSAPSSPRCSSRATPTGSPRPAVAGGPAVVLVVGVNGTGKTTTIGKLAAATRPRAARSSSPPRTRSAPPPSTSSGSGPSAPASRSSPTRPAPTPAPSSTTRSMPPSPAAPTSSSPTPPAGSTRSRTSWTS